MSAPGDLIPDAVGAVDHCIHTQDGLNFVDPHAEG